LLQNKKHNVNIAVEIDYDELNDALAQSLDEPMIREALQTENLRQFTRDVSDTTTMCLFVM
jgi:hypothetical protein